MLREAWGRGPDEPPPTPPPEVVTLKDEVANLRVILQDKNDATAASMGEMKTMIQLMMQKIELLAKP